MVINESYILIEIVNNDKDYIDSYLLVELITKEYNNRNYFLPINVYMLQTFDDKNNETFTENKYYFSFDEKYDDQTLIDFSSAYDEIDISFDKFVTRVVNGTLTGFKKYRVYNATDNDVYFRVINKKNRTKANYMIRYYYTGLGGEYNYFLNDSQKIIYKHILDNEKANISITYNSINITTGEKPYFVKKNNIYFYIYAFLFKKSKTT